MGTYNDFAAAGDAMNNADSYPEFAAAQARQNAAHGPAPEQPARHTIEPSAVAASQQTQTETDALRRGDYSPWDR
jgi:hypothetical protein